MAEFVQKIISITWTCKDCQETNFITFNFHHGDCEYVEDSDMNIYLQELDVYKADCPSCGEEQRCEVVVI